ncbi:mannosyltransferase family protein [[Phormidium] sp. ETS-05]|uniref:mannosyltransferase family protein n=1 Tax=[Phormidium] sp. ETS-05 TaxID=222819 RepID=UPI001E2BCA03|nr:mannosyltransferase family protein [[Phormidium] sp. ETS-05]
MVSVKAPKPEGIEFAAVMWLASRGVVLAAMLGVAPLLQAPPGGIAATADLSVFSAWDSVYYEKIASFGYAVDGGEGLVAFFPLFPLAMRGLMGLGLPVLWAGVLVNNLAFFGALVVVYQLVANRHGPGAARWTTAALAWCPFSLFATVIYSEGLFLFLSGAALRAFERREYGQVVLWGGLATATRPTGVALVGAFLITAFRERRPVAAWVASVAASWGLLLFSIYCWRKFGNPLAFVAAQRFWRPESGFDWRGWGKIILQVFLGQGNVRAGMLKDPWHPLLMVIIGILGWLLWRFRSRLGEVWCGSGVCLLVVLLWLLGGDPLVNGVAIFGSGYLLWRWRRELSLVVVVYGFCGLGLILASGSTISLARIAYGIVPLSVALGVAISRAGRWGYPAMVFLGMMLVSLSVRFAQHLWAG